MTLPPKKSLSPESLRFDQRAKNLSLAVPGQTQSPLFNKIYAGQVPGTSNSYVQVENLIPWPPGVNKSYVVRHDHELRASARLLRDAVDYAINGLRPEYAKFTIEVPLSYGLGGRPETNMSIFVYPPDNEAQYDPEKIVGFIRENKNQISQRVNEYLLNNRFSEQSK